jgi:hypothetical protein
MYEVNYPFYKYDKICNNVKRDSNIQLPPIASFQRIEAYEYQPIKNQLIIDPKGVNTNA